MRTSPKLSLQFLSNVTSPFFGPVRMLDLLFSLSTEAKEKEGIDELTGEAHLSWEHTYVLSIRLSGEIES